MEVAMDFYYHQLSCHIVESALRSHRQGQNSTVDRYLSVNLCDVCEKTSDGPNIPPELGHYRTRKKTFA